MTARLEGGGERKGAIVPNVYIYNLLLGGCGRQGRWEEFWNCVLLG